VTGPVARDYEAELLRIADDFVAGETGFYTFLEQFSNCYFRDMPDGVLDDLASEFWDEVNEQLTIAGDFGDVTIEDFRMWLSEVRKTYPALA
jgi:hypothetical protein